MWIQRTPEEITKWQKAAESEARSHGRFIAGIVWVAVSMLCAGGWFIFLSGGAGVVVQSDVSGSFWLRLPIFGLVAAPIAYWIFRHERRKELTKIARRTICPKCDTPADGNPGANCQCGGSFVPASTVRWVEN
ncbi:MAG: hypothetical protein P4N60_13840 [Verrucomicrobiae bacterium]|nr:hypothetical protein [Verrucomicrobiae bacterium]